MTDKAAYSRVYWSAIDDEKFADVWDDDHHLATWLRLLVAADMAWPASAYQPAGVRKASLSKLIEVGLVTKQPGFRYRIKGLDAERERRKASATRNPTGTQLGPNWDPDGNDIPPLSQAEPSRAEKRLAEQGADDAGMVYATLYGRPSAKALSWIDDLSSRYGAKETGNAIAQAAKDGIAQGRILGVAESYLAESTRRELRKPQRRNPLLAQIAASIGEKYGPDVA